MVGLTIPTEELLYSWQGARATTSTLKRVQSLLKGRSHDEWEGIAPLALPCYHLKDM